MAKTKPGGSQIEQAMTIQDMINMLEGLKNEHGPDMPVVFEYQSGDHWRTMVAQPATDMNPGTVEYSSYHQKFKIDESDDNEDPETAEDRDTESHRVIIIS